MENPYQHICRLGCAAHNTMTSSAHAHYTTTTPTHTMNGAAHKCTTTTANSNQHSTCKYTRVQSDYDLSDSPGTHSLLFNHDVNGGVVTTLPSTQTVTYVCRKNKDYDKLQRPAPAPQIVQDSQLCPGVFRNGSNLSRIREETQGSRRSIVSSRSCENL